MEKIYLASTNNVFFQRLIGDIRESIPGFHNKKKKIMQIRKKDDLIHLIDNNEYDLIIMDKSILPPEEIDKKVKLKKEGLIWLIDDAKSQKVTDHYYIWDSKEIDKYKKILYRLGMSNPNLSKQMDTTPIMQEKKTNNKQESASKVKSTKNKIVEEKKNKEKVSQHNRQKDINGKNTSVETLTGGLSKNQRKILAAQEQKNHENIDDEESPVISIAPPYPGEILDDSVHYRMMETKNMKLDNDETEVLDKRTERLLELKSYVNEYFNLVTQKEFMQQIDRRLLASIELYDYVNMNRSLKNKPIGVWSPIRGIGVTAFVMNFAFHIGSRGLPLSVMEALRKEPALYKELERLTPNKKTIPKKWQSYVSYINKRKEVEKPISEWIESSIIDYKGVYWYPLGKDDFPQSNIDDIPYYMAAANPKEIVLIDLPNGDLEFDTRLMLSKLKELWIILDGSTKTIFSYKKYIRELQLNNPNLQISIILLNYFPMVSKKTIRSTFDYPVLATLPDLNDEVRKNKYEQISIMDNPDIEMKLEDGFSRIASHVYEDTYKRSSRINGYRKNTNFMKSLDKIKSIFV